MFLKAKRSFGTIALMAVAILALLFSTGGTGTRTAMAESDDEAQAAATQGQHSTWMTVRSEHPRTFTTCR